MSLTTYPHQKRLESIFSTKSDIKEILALNVGNNSGIKEEFSTIFPSADFHLTDPNPQSHDVQKLSHRQALANYSNADLLILIDLPNTIEYSDTLALFPGRFIIHIGDFSYHQFEWSLEMGWKILFCKGNLRVWEKLFHDNTDSNAIFSSLEEYDLTKTISLTNRNTKHISELEIRTLQNFWSTNIDSSSIKNVLAINSGDGKIEVALIRLLFPKAQMHLTDIVPLPPHIEGLSARDAIIKYHDSDLIITVWPDFRAKGYRNILTPYEGKYIMYFGEEDSSDPEFLFVDQLDNWGETIFNFGIDKGFERMIIRKKKIGPPEAETDSESESDSDSEQKQQALC